MSGTSGSEDCPRCGSVDSMMTSYDWKPHQGCSGTCLVCGYSYWTELGFVDKVQLEEERKNYDFKPVEITDKMMKRMMEYDKNYGIKK